MDEFIEDIKSRSNSYLSLGRPLSADFYKNSSIASELINANPLPSEPSIVDSIIGYDELRSCIILNFNQYENELSYIYKFKVDIKRATDFASEWKSLL